MFSGRFFWICAESSNLIHFCTMLSPCMRERKKKFKSSMQWFPELLGVAMRSCHPHFHRLGMLFPGLCMFNFYKRCPDSLLTNICWQIDVALDRIMCGLQHFIVNRLDFRQPICLKKKVHFPKWMACAWHKKCNSV